MARAPAPVFVIDCLAFARSPGGFWIAPLMDQIENILLIRLKSIGDVVFTLPAVHAVREWFPGARLHFLVSQEHAELLQGFNDVDEIIPLDRKMFSDGSPLAVAVAVARLLRRLRRSQFDLTIDFQGFGETEWLSYFSGAPERLGNVYNVHRGWTYTRTSPRDVTTHPAEWNLALLQTLGINPGKPRNEYFLPAEPLRAARDFFRASPLSPECPVLFLQPFTSNAEKNWPLDKFLELAQHYRQQGAQVVFGGGPGDRSRLAPAQASGFCVAAGTPLLVSAGLMQLSAVVVGADTGLLHLATAMGKRVVMIMHSNQPGSCHPFQHPGWVVTCGTGNKISDVPVGEVIAACDQALKDG
jgi:heptosyltransferase-1